MADTAWSSTPTCAGDCRIYIDGVMLPVRAAKEADFSRVALSNLRSIVQQTLRLARGVGFIPPEWCGLCRVGRFVAPPVNV